MRGVSHFEVTVRDLEASLRFYRDLLGLTVLQQGRTDAAFPNAGRLRVYERDERVFEFAVLDCSAEPAPFGLGEAPTIVLLSPLGSPATGTSIKLDQVGITHFGLWVDGLDAVYYRLTGEGIAFLEPPHTMLELPYGTVRSAFTQDPDGVIVQLDELVARRAPSSA